jgi:hypothetical protein
MHRYTYYVGSVPHVNIQYIYTVYIPTLSHTSYVQYIQYILRTLSVVPTVPLLVQVTKRSVAEDDDYDASLLSKSPIINTVPRVFIPFSVWILTVPANLRKETTKIGSFVQLEA